MCSYNLTSLAHGAYLELKRCSTTSNLLAKTSYQEKPDIVKNGNIPIVKDNGCNLSPFLVCVIALLDIIILATDAGHIPK